jgi:hypothetical protein
MSDKCQHNNHSHFMLWWFIWLLFMESCVDCSGERTRMKNDIRQLEWKVQQLEQTCNFRK